MVRSWPTYQADTRRRDGGRHHDEGEHRADLQHQRRPAAARRARRRCRGRSSSPATAASRSKPSMPRSRKAASTWIGMTRSAVSPRIVAGARFRIVNPPSRRSDIVIGASTGRRAWAAVSRRRRSPRRDRAGRGASSGDVGGGPLHGCSSTGRNADRRSGRPFEPPHCWAWRATTRRPTASGFADVYDDWYGDVTDVDACTKRLAALAEDGAGARARRGDRAAGLAARRPSAWRSTASTPRRRCWRASGPSPAATRCRLTARRHGRAGARRPARRSPWCSRRSTRCSTSTPTGRAAAVPRGPPTCSRRPGC